MHEFGLASILIQNLLKQVEEHNTTKVLSVEVEIGEFNFLNEDQFQFCYSSLIPGISLEQSELKLSTSKGRVICVSCDYEGPMKYLDEEGIRLTGIPTFSCPECSNLTKVKKGHEITIKRLKVIG